MAKDHAISDMFVQHAAINGNTKGPCLEKWDMCLVHARRRRFAACAAVARQLYHLLRGRIALYQRALHSSLHPVVASHMAYRRSSEGMPSCI